MVVVSDMKGNINVMGEGHQKVFLLILKGMGIVYMYIICAVMCPKEKWRLRAVKFVTSKSYSLARI